MAPALCSAHPLVFSGLPAAPLLMHMLGLRRAVCVTRHIYCRPRNTTQLTPRNAPLRPPPSIHTSQLDEKDIGRLKDDIRRYKDDIKRADSDVRVRTTLRPRGSQHGRVTPR